MSELGVIKRASSLSGQRRRLKPLTTKERSLSLSLPRSPYLLSTGGCSQTQESEEDFLCALRQGKANRCNQVLTTANSDTEGENYLKQKQAEVEQCSPSSGNGACGTQPSFIKRENFYYCGFYYMSRAAREGTSAELVDPPQLLVPPYLPDSPLQSPHPQSSLLQPQPLNSVPPTPPRPPTPPPPPISHTSPTLIPMSCLPFHPEVTLVDEAPSHSDLNRLSDDSDDSDGWDRFTYDGNDMFYCYVCYNEACNMMDQVHCTVCLSYFCKQCVQTHIVTKITEGFVTIKCPGEACTKSLPDEEIELHSGELFKLFVKNKVDAENNPQIRTCPGCNIVQRFEDFDNIPIHHRCKACGLRWCVPCHAPWHFGMTCKKFQKDVVGKGRKALKVWAKGKGKSYSNAIKCPHCKFFIERISGCDHMCCSRCSTDFCYRCGKKHRNGGILGDHYSRFSFFGCKYNLLPNKPVMRVAVRSGVIVGGAMVVPLAGALVLSAVCIFLAVAPVAVPSYCIAKKCRK